MKKPQHAVTKEVETGGLDQGMYDWGLEEWADGICMVAKNQGGIESHYCFFIIPPRSEAGRYQNPAYHLSLRLKSEEQIPVQGRLSHPQLPRWAVSGRCQNRSRVWVWIQISIAAL